MRVKYPVCKDLMWHLRIDDGGVVIDCVGREWPTCSAGLFSKWLYVEIVQGVDLVTGTEFYRWLIIGIPRRGQWRIRLLKRRIP